MNHIQQEADLEVQFEQDFEELEKASGSPSILEDLLAESLPQSSADIDPLEALLDESMSSVREQAEAKAARDRIKRGGLSAGEAAEDALRIKAWEAKHEWAGVANAAVFLEVECDCGASTRFFEALMQRQKHRHLRDSFRWQAVEASNAALPNEVILRKRFVPACELCCEAKGWVLAGAREWEA